MKKKIFFLMLFMPLFVFSGCGKKDEAKEQKSIFQESGDSQNVEKKTLLDWIGGNKVIQCEIKTFDGDMTVKIKGNDFYMEGIPYVSPDSAGEVLQAKNGAMLNSGDWNYMWDKSTKKGTKMNMKELGETANEEENKNDIKNLAGEWEESGFNYNCREISEVSGMFSEPSDIEFMNLNDLMGNMADFGEKSQEIGEDGVMSNEELQKMMDDISR